MLFSDYSNRFTYHDIASARRAQRGDTIIDSATGSPNSADIPGDLLRSVSIEAFESRRFDGQPGSPIEGFDELRALLAEHVSTHGVQCDVRNVMMLSGSEQGIDLIAHAFISPGSYTLVKQSTFFPALQTFRSAGARIIGVLVGEHGMRTDLLDGYCTRFRPELIYTIPTFRNPTGTTLPPERRGELIDVARCYQCLIVEDDAYGGLWYDGESSDIHRPIPLRGMENAEYVIYLSTFSKTVTSGPRTGWVVTDPHAINRLTTLRRMVDQHTNTSSQRVYLEPFKEGRVAEHLRGLIKACRIRRDATITVSERYTSDKIYWTVPAGGYYIWVSLPGGVRSLDVLESCHSQGVTFMPGSVFDVDKMDGSHTRLNFARPDAASIDTGIRITDEMTAQM